jgi:hypothetical protein
LISLRLDSIHHVPFVSGLQHFSPSEADTKAIHPPPEWGDLSGWGQKDLFNPSHLCFVSTECLPFYLAEKPLDTSALRLIGAAKRPTKQLTALVFFGSNIIKAIFSFFFFFSVAQQGGHCRNNQINYACLCLPDSQPRDVYLFFPFLSRHQTTCAPPGPVSDVVDNCHAITTVLLRLRTTLVVSISFSSNQTKIPSVQNGAFGLKRTASFISASAYRSPSMSQHPARRNLRRKKVESFWVLIGRQRFTAGR